MGESLSKKARTVRKVAYLVAAIFALWLIIVVGSSLVRGLTSGEIYDPMTGLPYQADAGSD